MSSANETRLSTPLPLSSVVDGSVSEFEMKVGNGSGNWKKNSRSRVLNGCNEKLIFSRIYEYVV